MFVLSVLVTTDIFFSDLSSSGSTKNSPNHWPTLSDSGRTSAGNSPKSSAKQKPKEKEDNSAWGYLKKLGLGLQSDRSESVDAPTNSSDSMFHWDTLSILRASRQQAARENDDPQLKAPGSGLVSSKNKKKNENNVKSMLSPDSAEFVPAAIRMSKAVGSNLKAKKNDKNWANVDDSVLETLRPPPGLTKQKNIWDVDEMGIGSSLNKSPLYDFEESGYSSLLGNKKRSGDVSILLDSLNTNTSSVFRMLQARVFFFSCIIKSYVFIF